VEVYCPRPSTKFLRVRDGGERKTEETEEGDKRKGKDGKWRDGEKKKGRRKE